VTILYFKPTIKKKTIFVLILCNLFLLSSFAFAAKQPSIVGESAILIDKNSGQILFEKNSDKIMYPASTTKIMTGILTLELANLDDKVVVDEKTPYEISGSHIALESGEIITIKDLLYATMIESANDAAVVLAKKVGGSVESFANLMNEKAKSLGLEHTNFVNPNGLPNPNHTTTAHDLAYIMKYATENEMFKSIISNYTYTINPTNKKDVPRYLKSENKMLYGKGTGNKIDVNGSTKDIYYPGIMGGKTGYTPEAKSCLVSYAKRGDMELISVVLKSSGKNIWIDSHKLLDYGFDNFKSTTLAAKGTYLKMLPVTNGVFSQVPAVISQSFSIVLPPDQLESVKTELILSDSIDAPVYDGQILGEQIYTLNGNSVGNTKIIAAQNIDRKPESKTKEEGPKISVSKTLFYSLIGYSCFISLLTILRIRKRLKQLDDM
jgi:D-alanyl-D-alanine carboxypeptidase (penicillin-binding protein 5/6)